MQLPIRIGDCTITSVETPAIDSIEYEFGQGELLIEYDGFSSPEGDACLYTWSYSSTLDDNTALNPDLISFDADKRTFKIDSAAGVA